MSDPQEPPDLILLEQARAKFPVLAFFKYAHLPEVLQKFSKPFAVLADSMAMKLLDSPHAAEVAMGLRKLLEAKDCFVRARLPADGTPIPK